MKGQSPRSTGNQKEGGNRSKKEPAGTNFLNGKKKKLLRPKDCSDKEVNRRRDGKGRGWVLVSPSRRMGKGPQEGLCHLQNLPLKSLRVRVEKATGEKPCTTE